MIILLNILCFYLAVSKSMTYHGSIVECALMFLIGHIGAAASAAAFSPTIPFDVALEEQS